MQIVSAKFVSCKNGNKKFKILIPEEVENLQNGLLVNEKIVWVFATRVYDALLEVGIDPGSATSSDVASALKDGTIVFHFEEDENSMWSNAVIDSLLLSDNGVKKLEDFKVLRQLPPAQQERRLERMAKANVADAVKTLAKARKELEARVSGAADAAAKAEAIAKAEAAVAKAEAAVAADPSPANKGKLTRARKALAAIK